MAVEMFAPEFQIYFHCKLYTTQIHRKQTAICSFAHSISIEIVQFAEKCIFRRIDRNTISRRSASFCATATLMSIAKALSCFYDLNIVRLQIIFQNKIFSISSSHLFEVFFFGLCVFVAACLLSIVGYTRLQSVSGDQQILRSAWLTQRRCTGNGFQS